MRSHDELEGSRAGKSKRSASESGREETEYSTSIDASSRVIVALLYSCLTRAVVRAYEGALAWLANWNANDTFRWVSAITC